MAEGIVSPGWLIVAFLAGCIVTLAFCTRALVKANKTAETYRDLFLSSRR